MLRYEGPVGVPGMRKVLAATGATRQRTRRDVVLVTDGRFSGAARSLCVGHVTAAAGGPLSLVEQNGHLITIDQQKHVLDVAFDEPKGAQRRSRRHPFAPRHSLGLSGRYAASVGSADVGAVTGYRQAGVVGREL